jgi:hypothetical protein
MKPRPASNEVPERAVHAPVGEHALEIVVIFTAEKQTLEALRTAASLAQGLDGAIHVIVPQVVPFPLPLDRPPVDLDFTESRFRTLIPNRPIQTWVDVRLCREESDILSALAPKSLVVIGVRTRWWPQSDRRLARLLRAEGHHVLMTECERG